MSDCFICKKHKSLEEFTGPVIAEKNGLIMTHFPQVPDERAVEGWLIVEPRRHICQMSEMNRDEAAALGVLIGEGEKAIKQVLGAEHVYLSRINDKVAHLHFHLIPRYPGTPRDFWGTKITAWPDFKTVGLERIKVLSMALGQAIIC